MDNWVSLITDVGFPIAVTLYLLNRIEAKLDTLNQSVRELPELLRNGTTFPADKLSS